MDNVLRGDIYYANLNPVIGSEQGGVRPVLILQNDIGNKYSPTTIVAAITADQKAKLPPMWSSIAPISPWRGFCYSAGADPHH